MQKSPCLPSTTILKILGRTLHHLARTYTSRDLQCFSSNSPGVYSLRKPFKNQTAQERTYLNLSNKNSCFTFAINSFCCILFFNSIGVMNTPLELSLVLFKLFNSLTLVCLPYSALVPLNPACKQTPSHCVTVILMQSHFYVLVI